MCGLNPVAMHGSMGILHAVNMIPALNPRLDTISALLTVRGRDLSELLNCSLVVL